jgi:pantothenate kinase
MEQQILQLSNYLISKVESLNNNKKYIIGIGGIPGSGKSAFSNKLCNCINQILNKTICIVLSMDGFHYYKKQLDKMPNSKELYKRRGSPWTFWTEGFYNLLEKLREFNEINAPSFDHQKGDPVENDIIITKEHKIVLIEGNYLLLDEPPWNTKTFLFDELWYITCDIDIAMKRILLRHMKCFGINEQEAKDRYL